jgi:hypothetical protein
MVVSNGRSFDTVNMSYSGDDWLSAEALLPAATQGERG